MMRMLTLIVLLAVAASSFAQTGPALMLKPFAEGQNLEFWSQGTFLDNGQTDDNDLPDDMNVDIFMFDAAGRWRITGEDQRNITVGAAISHMDISTSFALLPEQFTDQSVAVGAHLGDWSDWSIDAVAGMGYAGSNAYHDANALYFMGNVVASKKLDENSSLILMLDYNGNRTIWPDLPLPAIAYRHKASDTLSYVLGLPYSSVTWRPCDRAAVQIDYVVPSNLGVKVSYELFDNVTIFSLYNNQVKAFVHDDDVDNRRFFFEQSRVELGARWDMCANAGLEVAGGYAFNQSFERGYDLRDTDNIVDLDSEPYVRVAVNVGF